MGLWCGSTWLRLESNSWNCLIRLLMRFIPLLCSSSSVLLISEGGEGGLVDVRYTGRRRFLLRLVREPLVIGFDPGFPVGLFIRRVWAPSRIFRIRGDRRGTIDPGWGGSCERVRTILITFYTVGTRAKVQSVLGVVYFGYSEWTGGRVLDWWIAFLLMNTVLLALSHSSTGGIGRIWERIWDKVEIGFGTDLRGRGYKGKHRPMLPSLWDGKDKTLGGRKFFFLSLRRDRERVWAIGQGQGQRHFPNL